MIESIISENDDNGGRALRYKMNQHFSPPHPPSYETDVISYETMLLILDGPLILNHLKC